MKKGEGKDEGEGGVVGTVFPGLLDEIREFYKTYKVAEGKDNNKFGFGGRVLDQHEAYHVIGQANVNWSKLFVKDGRSLHENRFSLAQ